MKRNDLCHQLPFANAALVACFACLVLAAGARAQGESKELISAKNAGQVQSVKDVPMRAYRILRGPERGELTILDYNNAATIVDDTTFRTLRTLAKGHRPTDIAMSRDGKFLSWTERDKSTYTIQDTATGKTFTIEPGDMPGFVAFDPASKHIALGNTYWDPNAHGVGHSELKLYDITGKLLRTLEKTGPGAVQPVFSPDGKTLAVGNRNRETRLFDVATGKLLHTLDRQMTQEIAFSPDGKTLAAGYVNGTVALWDVATGKLLHSERSGCSEVYSVDWSPKGDLLATSGLGGKIVLWETDKLTKVKELDAPRWVIQVRFTADGTRLLTSSASDGTATKERKITVWAVPSK